MGNGRSVGTVSGSDVCASYSGLRLKELTEPMKESPKTSDSINPSTSVMLKSRGLRSPFTVSVRNRIPGWIIDSLVGFLGTSFPGDSGA